MITRYVMGLMMGWLVGYLMGRLKEMENIDYWEDERSEVITELINENNAYKRVIDKWKDDSNKTYWG